MYKHVMWSVFLALSAEAGLEKLKVGDTIFDQGSAEEVVSGFRKVAGPRKVLMLIGYSGRGYEDRALLQSSVEALLTEYSPAEWIFNAGVTPDGIGEMYGVEKAMGFLTFGVVSSEAVPYLKYVTNADHPFIVNDATWGGYIDGTKDLHPVSKAMEEVSDIMVAYGSGEIGLSELEVALTHGKTVQAHMMEQHHATCRAAAKLKQLPEPTQFYLPKFKAFVDALEDQKMIAIARAEKERKRPSSA